MYKIARVRLQNNEDIADVFQETMIKAFKSIKRLKNNEYFKTWLIKILINNCNDVYKRKKGEIEVQYTDLKEVKHTTNREFEKVDSNIDFDFIIKKLNYDEKIVLTLYYAEGYTSKEISTILKINENTIKARIARAKNKIKEMEEKEEWLI